MVNNSLQTLGKYELRERIGRGGMAEVYKAYHASLDRYVAVKVLHPFLGEDAEFKERFEREARNVAQLRHPNIVQVYDFEYDSERELYYMVMEYVDGPTLRTRIRYLQAHGELMPIREAVNIVHKLANALAYAHSRGMIHRDIKPGNIMLDTEGRVVLTDFGIARIVGGVSATASGSMVGTPAYMSPEQGLGQAGDNRSDIYSLGVVLYQLLTGTTPFDADTPIAIVLKHVNEPLPPPSSLNADLPPELERILYKALGKDPEDRYQTIETMMAELGQTLGSLPAMFDEPGVISPAAQQIASLQQPSQASSRRNGIQLALLIAVALIAAITGGILAYNGWFEAYFPVTLNNLLNTLFV